jgi:hypothetical protein
VYFLMGDYETALDVAVETLTRLSGQPVTHSGSPPGLMDEALVLRAAAEAARRRTRPGQVPAKANNPVLAALGALPWESRTLLIWHELNGLTEEEAAGLLEITPGEAFARLEQARARFAAAYAPSLPPNPALALEALRAADGPPLPPMFMRLVERAVEKSRSAASRGETQEQVSWRVDCIRITPTEGPVDLECHPSELRKRWWIEQLRPGPRAISILAVGLSVVALVAVGLWNPRWNQNPASAGGIPPGVRAETHAKAPSAEASVDSINKAMTGRGLVEYQGEWLTPESRDEREVTRLMTARGYIYHDGVWTEERQYLESKSRREPDTAAQVPETSKIEVSSVAVQLPVTPNSPPAPEPAAQAKENPKPPREPQAVEKGVGLTAAEQATIDEAILRIKEDLLATCLLSPLDQNRLLSKKLTLAEQRKLGAQDDDPRRRLHQAIEEAEKKGTAPPFRPKNFQYGHGEETLVGLALIKAGVSPDHPLIRRIWSDLQRPDLPPDSGAGTTYRDGVGLMFVEAMIHSPGWEPGEDAKVQAWVRRVAEKLVAAGGERGRWGYGAGGSYFDNSNTQYATLGLKAARLCGWKPDPTRGSMLWQAVLDHFLRAQEKDGPPVQVKVQTGKADQSGVDYASSVWEKSLDSDYDYQATAMARGWSYVVSYDQVLKPGRIINAGAVSGGASLNMTIAGLTAIILARSEMGSLRKEDEARTDQAIRDAMAWVQEHWTGGADGYGLYGIERLGVLGNLAKIGGHDWYRELAPGLATWALADNIGPAAYGQCAERAFWLLFLSRGTSSAYASPVSDDRP